MGQTEESDANAGCFGTAMKVTRVKFNRASSGDGIERNEFRRHAAPLASNLLSERHHGTFNRTGSGVLSEIPGPKDPCAAAQAFFCDLDDLASKEQ